MTRVDALELMVAVLKVPGLAAYLVGGDVVVDVGHGVPAVRIDADVVDGWTYGRSPTGSPAIQIRLEPSAGRNEKTRLFLTLGDVAFEPDAQRASLDIWPNGPQYLVRKMPPLVAYSEVLRTLEHLELSVDSQPNTDRVEGTILMLLAFWRGGQRAGLDVSGLNLRIHDLRMRVEDSG